MPEPAAFHFHRTIGKRNLLGLLIVGCICTAAISSGLMLYTGAVDSLRGFFSAFLLFAGVSGLVAEATHQIGYRDATAAWTISLNQDHFEWQAPKHLWRKEVSFKVPVSTILQLVRVVPEDSDPRNSNEYWLQLQDRRLIRLCDNSGVSLSGIFSAAEKL